MFDFEVAMGLEKIEIFSPQMNADERRLVKHKKAFICVHPRSSVENYFFVYYINCHK